MFFVIVVRGISQMPWLAEGCGRMWIPESVKKRKTSELFSSSRCGRGGKLPSAKSRSALPNQRRAGRYGGNLEGLS